MKTEPNEPIMPVSSLEDVEGSPMMLPDTNGLTKREAFAMAALTGYTHAGLSPWLAAESSVQSADALIKTLNQ